ncbi:MAG: ammonia channel protein [Acidobacteria bacterium]|jgi:Amt family ammonium transporter|nr:ammonia channel protein [Acidobacteriota bacterium]MDP7339130.1 ammonium transporter [Vicinamibacterales bacterium]MDP7480296.1 ammonium transporter [Vicinamibacterales bacterium]HJN44220.1 ammonium transporter [Vicinamibacterales bacterium]
MTTLKRRTAVLVAAAMLVLALPRLAVAQDGLSAGDTAWMLTSSVLVLFMTIPGLALFYAGLVRAKNVLSVMMQCFALTCMVTVLWTVYVYGLAFGDGGGLNDYIGFGKFFLSGVSVDSLWPGTAIPESVYQMFQLTFAIITPALIVGAFAERMKFSAMMVFMSLWVTFVYAPVAHWVWGGGFLSQMGVLDFAGGTVVHINAGVAALVLCILLGRRAGYPTTSMAPNSLVLTVVGASMLWVGWFGFNAGSELAADGTAGMAMAVTHISTAMAGFTWMLIEWSSHGKPSVLGVATGAVAGLVAITPASGYVGPVGALTIGLSAGVLCYWGANGLKRQFGYDDSLDVFGVHGVGGIVGALLTGVFASSALGGSEEGLNIGSQLGLQAVGVGTTLVYSGVVTFILVKVVDGLIGIRVTDEEESTGLDLALHDERGFSL